MLNKRTRIKVFLTQVISILVAVAAAWLLGTWLLSTPASNASDALPDLTFWSPIPPTGNPELGVAKTVNNDAPEPGDEIEYTLTYSTTNPGSQAFNARLYEFLPAGVQLVSSNPTASYADGALVFTFPSIGPANQTASVRVRVLEGHSQLQNHALLTADGVTPTHDSLLTVVTPPSPYLNLSKLGDEGVLVSGEIVYILRCENPSGFAVNDVTVVDVLPTGVTLNASSLPLDPGWSSPVLRWSLGDLGPGESQTIVITTTAPSSTDRITNTALADARQRVVTQTVFATDVVTEAASLRLTKHASAGAVNVGDDLVYTLRYRNIGNQVATGVVLTDLLPSEVTVTGIISQSPLISSDPLVWSIGAVTPGLAPGEIVITTTVNGGWGTTISNVAEIRALGAYGGYAEVFTSIRLAKLYLPIVTRKSE
jgi:uncharacterized repeat protein (TIGR01451 family)